MLKVMRRHLKKPPHSYARAPPRLFLCSIFLSLSISPSPLRSDLMNANMTPSADCEPSVGARLRRNRLKLSCASDAHLWQRLLLAGNETLRRISFCTFRRSSISVSRNVSQKRWIRDWACLLLFYHKVMFLLYCKKKQSCCELLQQGNTSKLCESLWFG